MSLGYPTPAATSQTYYVNDTPFAWRRFGRYGFTGSATLPNGDIGVTVSNVGYIDQNSIIVVFPVGTGQPLQETKYDLSGNMLRTTGDNGTFIVSTSNATPVTADQAFIFMVVNL